jgi:hypothetical protein
MSIRNRRQCWQCQQSELVSIVATRISHWLSKPDLADTRSVQWKYMLVDDSVSTLFTAGVITLRPAGFFFLLLIVNLIYEAVSIRFRTGRLGRELQMIQLSAIKCSCIAILWVSLVSFAAITLYIACQQVFIVVVYFVIDSVWKLLDTPS